MDEAPDFADWAVGAAGEVVELAERHGVRITWSEAHERVLNESGHGPLRIINEDGTLEPVQNGLGWRHPDFVETVAATHVHFHGGAYHPTRRDSEVPVAVSTHTIVEAHVRLSFLLHACVGTPNPGIDCSKLSALVTALGYHIGDDHLAGLDSGSPHEKLDESQYVLFSAREVSDTIDFLEAGEAIITDANHLAAPLPPALVESLLDPKGYQACVLALRWWLGTA